MYFIKINIFFLNMVWRGVKIFNKFSLIYTITIKWISIYVEMEKKKTKNFYLSRVSQPSEKYEVYMCMHFTCPYSKENKNVLENKK